MRVREATEEERTTRDRVTFLAWGTGLEFSQYQERERILRAHAFSQERMTTWLLVSERDQVLSSCETFRLNAWHRGARREAYGLATVFTEESLRGQGHATKLVNGVLETLGQKNVPTAAVLFSDVGAELYRRSGFVARPAFDWVLTAEKGTVDANVDALLHVHDVIPEAHGWGDFRIIPPREQLDWQWERERLYARMLSRFRPPCVGARAGMSTATWMADMKTSTLLVLTLEGRQPPEIAALLRCAQRVAFAAGLSSVRVWECDPPAELLAQLPLGRVPRSGSLPMIRPLAEGLAAEDWAWIPRAVWL
jgi:GNAT superfamily N-acetyltransferase